MKVCAKCGVEKPYTEYTMRKYRGRIYPMTYCKPALLPSVGVSITLTI